MILRFVLATACGISVLSAQPIDVTDGLVYPVNPPRAAAASPETIAKLTFHNFSEEQSQEISKTRKDLKSALDSGLGEDHPTVKNLRAKLASLENTTRRTSNADGRNEIQQLRDEVKQMKDELAKLRKEVAELKSKE